MNYAKEPGALCLVYTTTPDEDLGAKIAREVVTKKLAACVTRLKDGRSTYIWNGELQEDQENLLIMKSSQDNLEALISCIKSLHPYSVPEIIVTPIVGGSRSYLDWILNQTSQAEPFATLK